MSKPDIKIDMDSFQSTLDLLKNSIDEFKSYTTSFRDNTRDQLGSFKSDFIDKVDALLDNMKNDMNTDLVDKLNWIHQSGQSILDEMRRSDEEISSVIKGVSS